MIKKLFRTLLGSKKFASLLIGVVAVIATRLGLEEAAAHDASLHVVGLVCTYLGAQGIADFGKGKAEVEAREPAPEAAPASPAE